jgi:uncharacterized Zn-binding protein involved in type VI secretion
MIVTEASSIADPSFDIVFDVCPTCDLGDAVSCPSCNATGHLSVRVAAPVAARPSLAPTRTNAA